MIYTQLIINLSLLISLSVLSIFISTKFKKETILGKSLQGILFGAVAVVAMIFPFTLTDGLIFDGRSVIISVAALFFGPITGIISAIMALTYRTIIGGGGALVGIVIIMISYLIGVITRYKTKKDEGRILTNWELYIFGIIVHVAMIIILFTFQSIGISKSLLRISLNVIITFPIATLLIGIILQVQERNNIYIKELKKALTKLKFHSENTPLGLLELNSEFEIVQWSKRSEEIFGWSKEEAVGRTLEELKLIYKGD